MYIKCSAGFLLASLAQAGIIMVTEYLGISTLGANLTPTQLLIHIVAGQILGYILLFIMRNLKLARTTNIFATGIIAGIIAWAILLPINSAIGKINPPWDQGFSTVTASLIAFIVFGIISAYTIKKYAHEN